MAIGIFVLVSTASPERPLDWFLAVVQITGGGIAFVFGLNRLLLGVVRADREANELGKGEPPADALMTGEALVTREEVQFL